jgi:hypothetical protein
MTKRLPGWAIVAGGTAMATAAFFASANITHWVMGLQQTQVVVRPGPTVYLTGPAGRGHPPVRALPAPAPAGPALDVGVPSRQDAHASPDHEGRQPHGPGPGAAHHHGVKGVSHGRGH